VFLFCGLFTLFPRVASTVRERSRSGFKLRPGFGCVNFDSRRLRHGFALRGVSFFTFHFSTRLLPTGIVEKQPSYSIIIFRSAHAAIVRR
jgi:hypothetical protein